MKILFTTFRAAVSVGQVLRTHLASFEHLQCYPQELKQSINTAPSQANGSQVPALFKPLFRASPKIALLLLGEQQLPCTQKHEETKTISLLMAKNAFLFSLPPLAHSPEPS
jgi:hypothetical protein